MNNKKIITLNVDEVKKKVRDYIENTCGDKYNQDLKEQFIKNFLKRFYGI